MLTTKTAEAFVPTGISFISLYAACEESRGKPWRIMTSEHKIKGHPGTWLCGHIELFCHGQGWVPSQYGKVSEFKRSVRDREVTLCVLKKPFNPDSFPFSIACFMLRTDTIPRASRSQYLVSSQCDSVEELFETLECQAYLSLDSMSEEFLTVFGNAEVPFLHGSTKP